MLLVVCRYAKQNKSIYCLLLVVYYAVCCFLFFVVCLQCTGVCKTTVFLLLFVVEKPMEYLTTINNSDNTVYFANTGIVVPGWLFLNVFSNTNNQKQTNTTTEIYKQTNKQTAGNRKNRNIQTTNKEQTLLLLLLLLLL